MALAQILLGPTPFCLRDTVLNVSKASASPLGEALPTFEKEQGDDYSLKNRQWVSRERVEWSIAA
jgi:hypothetical protein